MLEHFHTYTDDEARCYLCGGHVYEVSIRGRWHKTSAYMFRSWTGSRRIDGENYNGPVYFLGTEEVHHAA
jgi:hypothetical protein